MSKLKRIKPRVSNIDKLVAERLKTRRMQLKFNQSDIASVIGVTVQQIQKYEKAKDRISSSNLFLFSRFLSVPLNYFFSLDNETEAFTIGLKIIKIQGENISIKME